MRKEILRAPAAAAHDLFRQEPGGTADDEGDHGRGRAERLFAAGVVTMINDFFLLAVMAILLFSIDRRLALDALVVLPFIFVVRWCFRKYVRDANRKIRTAIARINAFLQEYISGMSVVQLFTASAKRERSLRAGTRTTCWRGGMPSSRMRCFIRGGIPELRDHRPDLLFGRQPDTGRNTEPGCSDRVHDVRAKILPADSGLEREIQHFAVGDGGFRTHLQAAG